MYIIKLYLINYFRNWHVIFYVNYQINVNNLKLHKFQTVSILEESKSHSIQILEFTLKIYERNAEKSSISFSQKSSFNSSEHTLQT